ncbi:hypothetical protein Pla52o_50930 [Novipirellula galeiformis]|uniref:HAMP domain-containing protein n=1 Tax=Novipirellula galeiformis TaxID=2528004 RepID=A0A5C6C0N9_9BACT|nr:hypothetical protein [Novipirellula galeiformis]TWU17537.1 hypothetical protein Pla52o_50930 [Novipirellula galeiformis]
MDSRLVIYQTIAADETMFDTQSRRSRTFVDREVQGGLLRRIALHWIIFFVCNAIALTIWIRLFEQPDVDWGRTFADTLQRFLPFFVITMALIPAFVWDTLKLTNRFAGPILRLRHALSDVRAGRTVAPLQFRSNDFWHQMAVDFNAIAERVHGTNKSGDDSSATGKEV